MRDIIVAGNWKMNKDHLLTVDFCVSLALDLQKRRTDGLKVIVAAPYPFLDAARGAFGDSVGMVAAQDVSAHTEGAYTGEVSAYMLASLQIPYSIVGHSERRQYHHESGEEIRQKLIRLLENERTPILCIGETLGEREEGLTTKVLETQLQEALKDIALEDGRELYIAYEPVWAIGTGKTATADQAQEAHAFIRAWLKDKYGAEIAQQIHILYGGSMKPQNIAELIAQPDIDGGLIGGASLVYEDFLAMIDTAITQAKTE
ncbi:MAG: triose-phosphate isomerase [Candidatus Cloacimonetes bacterium]|nr:triose-phosphate isomerase [Candidatus Cloacimonadota bacterium]